MTFILIHKEQVSRVNRSTFQLKKVQVCSQERVDGCEPLLLNIEECLNKKI